MALEVIYASTDRQLTTTGYLKELLLGATATSTERDGLFSRHIGRASAWAEGFIGQPLTVQTYRETLAGYGRRRLMLSHTPVRAVIAVYRGTDTEDATAIATSEFIVEDRGAGLLARNNGFQWSAAMQFSGGGLIGGDAIPLDPAPLAGQEYRPFLVDYVAGWTYDGISTDSDNWSTVKGTTSTGRTLPEDVEHGVLLKAQSLVLNNQDVHEERLGDLEVRYNARSVADDSEVHRPWGQALQSWRRVV